MNSNFLLQAIFESFIDGVLIVSDRGEVIYANRSAHEICRMLSPDGLKTMRLPSQIWRICQMLVNNRVLHQDMTVILEDEILTSSNNPLRIRVEWVSLESLERPCLRVTIEDRMQSARKRAIAERERYGLTEREAEVWLLRHLNWTYKAIAANLHITVDTVKKHVRNIYAKREAFEWAQE
ncbi:MAG: LuxR C-terminal-related transcriptional regulator [Cyanobacteriota bacterium]